MTGPGTVHLQSMPILNLAEEIARYLPGNDQHQNLGGAAAGLATVGVVGGILGGLLGGDN